MYPKIITCIIFTCSLFIAGCELNNSGGTGGEGFEPTGSPHFTYQIESGDVIKVNCEQIRFEATEGGDSVYPILATSASVRSTFSFAFYGSAAAIDSLETGEYPLIAYTGWTSDVPMHFSLKVPRTPGQTSNYFITVRDSSSEYKHTIDSIQKEGLEDGKRVFYVNGSFKLRARNIADDEMADISGSYRFKLLTVE